MNSTDINQKFNLLLLVAGKLRKAGGYHIGACPFCGGRDRFTIKHTKDGDRWHCRQCGDGKYHTVIDFIMRRDGCDFKAALQTLGGDSTRSQNIIHAAAPIQLPDSPPNEIWQARAMQLIERAESALWDARGADALAWLHTRGLRDETIRAARLGYIPKDAKPMKAESWGTPNDDPDPIYLWESILIPGLIAGKVWYLKMRLLHPRDAKDKYRGIRGNKTSALYGADLITADRAAAICEGEFDALLLRQELKGFASVVTLGSATNKLNIVTWGVYLWYPSSFVIAYDTDKAGKHGGDDLTWLHDAQRLQVPELRAGDKDLTDFHKSGGNLYSLIESVVREDAPIFVNWLEDVKPATVRGQYWENPDHRIEAYYLPAELSLCLAAMQAATA